MVLQWFSEKKNFACSCFTQQYVYYIAPVVPPPPPALQVAIKKTFGTSVMKKIWINLTARVSALSGFSTVLKIQPIETCSKM